MSKIAPFLWFDNNAKAAVDFYVSAFTNATIHNVARYPEGGRGTPGSVMTIAFEIEGMHFTALNGGTYASFSPAISFFVHSASREEIDTLWEKLSTGGNVLMPLDSYPYSERFGWLEDQFGVSWQLMLGSHTQKIVPCLLFVGDQFGNAEPAMQHYISLFADSGITQIQRSKAEDGSDGGVQYGSFTLQGQEFVAMESDWEHAFTFTPAISFFVTCDGQAEVDRLWDSLGDGGEIQQCGWLRDRYGVTWQIIPSILMDLMQDEDPEKAARVNEAMLKMTKIDVPTLQAAYAGT